VVSDKIIVARAVRLFRRMIVEGRQQSFRHSNNQFWIIPISIHLQIRSFLREFDNGNVDGIEKEGDERVES